MSNQYFEQLNPEQKVAVDHINGPLLVFAGAGSGKTRVITYRIANLIANHQVKPQSILAVTFTKKAAEEMHERIESIFTDIGLDIEDRPVIGTFHSICARILRQESQAVGLDPNFSIYDASDSESLIKELMLAADIDIKQIKPKAIYSMIGSAKNDMISPEEYPKVYSGFIEDYVAQLYPQYQQQLKDLNAVDFTDLLYITARAFDEKQEILDKYQAAFNYILVDEYQDTNKVQYQMVKRLSEKHENLCVVGDDDQSIYKWRGADIKNIISFEDDFNEVKVVKLEQNYRSVGNIIEAAVSVIGQNQERVSKELWTDKGPGDPIIIHQARDDKDEAEYVMEQIAKLRDRAYTLGDMAILYRTNFQSRVIEEALLERGLPYKLVGGFRFYDRKEVKDILSYLRFVNNPMDDVSLYRVINTPKRQMGPKSVSSLVKVAKEAGIQTGKLLIISYILNNREKHDPYEYGFTPEEVSKVESVLDEMESHKVVYGVFGSLYTYAQEHDAVQVIDKIIERVRYREFIDDGSEAAESRIENLVELKNVAASYVSRNPENSLNNFLQDIALIEQEQERNKKDVDQGAITLMTLHSSKGLEFPVVFMVGMEEGLLPHSRTFTDPTELEEERRLCYVGITRAKERLWMTFAESRSKMGAFESMIPSRFLGEIPQDICEYYSWNAGY